MTPLWENVLGSNIIAAGLTGCLNVKCDECRRRGMTNLPSGAHDVTLRVILNVLYFVCDVLLYLSDLFVVHKSVPY